MGKCIQKPNQPTPVKTEDPDKHLPKFQPLMPVHFEELNRLWPADTRIPSISSRRDWSLARGLNPGNVHNWWYRRRKHAKKLKISIPNESYELAVGTPPVVVYEIEDDARSDTYMEDADADDTCIPSSDGTATHIPSSEDVSSPTEGSDVVLKPLTTDCGDKLLRTMGQASSVSPFLKPQDQSRCSSRSRSPSPPLLFLSDHIDAQTPDEKMVAGGGALDDVRTEKDTHCKTPFTTTNVPNTPLSSCASRAMWKMPGMPSVRLGDLKLLSTDDERYTINLLPEEAPWCIDGFRIHYDGSVLGLCSCFSTRARVLPCSPFDDDIGLDA